MNGQPVAYAVGYAKNSGGVHIIMPTLGSLADATRVLNTLTKTQGAQYIGYEIYTIMRHVGIKP